MDSTLDGYRMMHLDGHRVASLYLYCQRSAVFFLSFVQYVVCKSSGLKEDTCMLSTQLFFDRCMNFHYVMDFFCMLRARQC